VTKRKLFLGSELTGIFWLYNKKLRGEKKEDAGYEKQCEISNDKENRHHYNQHGASRGKDGRGSIGETGRSPWARTETLSYDRGGEIPNGG